MTAFCKALAGSLALATAAGAFGQVYKWTDAEGRVHYGAQPPPAAKATSLANQRSHSANPESNVEVEVSAVQYYAVRGWTPLDLHMSMMQNGPFNEIVQRRVYAEINLQYKWKFDYAEESGRCRINKFVVTLASTITMPRWLLARRLRSLPAYETCQELNRVISNEGERVSAEYALANRAFDRTEALKDSPFTK